MCSLHVNKFKKRLYEEADNMIHSSNQSSLYQYLLLTEFKGRAVSYRPSFFLLDLWPKREARGP